MIVERRAYQVGSGNEQEFWAVQRDWYWPPEIGDFFNHLIGYFETVANGPTEIVHLYRYDSLADWEARYRALYHRFPPHMFTVVRKLLSAQQTCFMAPAPIALPNISPLDRPVGPPTGYELYEQRPPAGLLVQEVVTDFLPGGLFVHWDAIRELPNVSPAMQHNLIGTFNGITGRLHRMFEYRWFLSREDAAEHEVALANDHAAVSVTLRSEACRVGRSVSYLKPAPFPWLRPLFEPMDWAFFEARDPSQRRIHDWRQPQ